MQVVCCSPILVKQVLDCVLHGVMRGRDHAVLGQVHCMTLQKHLSCMHCKCEFNIVSEDVLQIHSVGANRHLSACTADEKA